MEAILGTPAVCRAQMSYARTMTTTGACSANTDGTTGTCNGSPIHYMLCLPTSAIKIPSFDWDKGSRYSEWLRFAKELDFTFDISTYASITPKD